MKNHAKRFLTLAIVLFVCITGIFAVATVPSEAAGKPTLSSKSVMIAMGGTQKITLKNGSGKWTIKDTSVARISSKTKKYAVVKPVKAGSTVLTCKVGSKKLTCKIKVLNNKTGNVNHVTGYPGKLIVGDTFTYTFENPENTTLDAVRLASDSDAGKAKVKLLKPFTESGTTYSQFKFTAIKPGKIDLVYTITENGTSKEISDFVIVIDNFRGKTKVSKTNKNYKKWRKHVITSMVSSDMSTWDIVDALGVLISSGKYGLKGGATGIQLWYGGNGTCVSGAKMMKDFMDDLGIKSKIHFMGKSGNSTDIYGYTIMYASQHKNTWIKLGGKYYELNPQPESYWPAGIVKRKKL